MFSWWMCSRARPPQVWLHGRRLRRARAETGISIPESTPTDSPQPLRLLTRFLGLNHLAAAQAGGADAHALGGRADFGVNRPQVDVPAPFAHVVGVADCIAAHRLLAANFTNLCHRTALQKLLELVVQTADCTGFERGSTSSGHRRVRHPASLCVRKIEVAPASGPARCR